MRSGQTGVDTWKGRAPSDARPQVFACCSSSAASRPEDAAEATGKPPARLLDPGAAAKDLDVDVAVLRKACDDHTAFRPLSVWLDKGMETRLGSQRRTQTRDS